MVYLRGGARGVNGAAILWQSSRVWDSEAVKNVSKKPPGCGDSPSSQLEGLTSVRQGVWVVDGPQTTERYVLSF